MFETAKKFQDKVFLDKHFKDRQEVINGLENCDVPSDLQGKRTRVFDIAQKYPMFNQDGEHTASTTNIIKSNG
jgi:hypothetical protein